MFKYSVIIQTVNIEGGQAATITLKDDYRSAEDLYYDTLSKVGSNPATAIVRVELRNTDGNPIKNELRVNQ